jgi:hypothetical protein
MEIEAVRVGKAEEVLTPVQIRELLPDVVGRQFMSIATNTGVMNPRFPAILHGD